MIKLTLQNGKRLWVNPMHILGLEEAPTGPGLCGTHIQMLSDTYWLVKESPEQVLSAITECQNEQALRGAQIATKASQESLNKMMSSFKD